MGERTPARTARLVGFVMLVAILGTLAIFWLVTALSGDPTNDLEERQPSPSASPS